MAKDLLANVLGAGCTVLVIAALPTAEVVVGASYLHRCPVAPVIPAYLLLRGALVLLLVGLVALPKLVCPGAAGNTTWTLSVLGLVLLLVAWVLFGSYHVYSVYPPNYAKNGAAGPDQNQAPPRADRPAMVDDGGALTRTIQALVQSKTTQVGKSTAEPVNVPGAAAAVRHCDRTVYLFAFWTTTLTHALAGVFLVAIACLYACMKVSVSLVSLVYS